jgi:gluconate 2-dehydrogenase alpha chain
VKILPKTEIVIVGLGAAGGIAAHVLTADGRSVVALEVGDDLNSGHFIKEMDEISGNGINNHLGAPLVNKSIPTWRPNERTPSGDPLRPALTMNGVGGSTVHYGGVSWRLYPDDFTIRSSTIQRYGEKALPEGSAIADWPLTYADLEPWYDKVEYAIGVSGDTSGNPWDPPRSRPFPMPPLRRKGWNLFAHDKLKGLGYHPFPQPTAINSVPYGGRAACSYCGYCSGYGCWNDSKGSTLVTTIPMARATGKLEIRTHARMTRILVDGKGKASGVRYIDAQGEECEQPASIVILSAFVYENVRRLLLSTSERFPNGLANNAGQVGKYFMTQAYTIVSGHYDDVDVKMFTGAGAQGTAFEDFYGDNFDHNGLGFIRGANIATFNESRPIGAAFNKPPQVPNWGPGFKAWLSKGIRSVQGIAAQMEVLPYHGNYLDLDPVKKDDIGEPVIRATFDHYENEHRMRDFLEAKLTGIHKAMGASQVWTAVRAPANAVFVHTYGGTRMGTDPKSSVVDQYCLAHEVPNLAIMGSSPFPSSGGRNPTETIQAVSWRAADYIARNFDRLAA